MPESTVEFELKFLVPAGARSALRAALGERGARLETRRLVARYFDTGDRRLARAGMSLRLRREGRRWVQALKAGGEAALERFEHEVPRPGPDLDVAAHAGTVAGDRMAELLADGEPLLQRYGTDIRRTTRTLRTRGAVVELAFDEGRIAALDRELRVCELEFELRSGPPGALFALAGQWRERFGLLVDPRSKAERGDALADGRAPASPRRAAPIRLRRKAAVAEAWRAALDECVAQVLANAIGLGAAVGVEGLAARSGARSPALERADFVHQLRIGLRRLRSAIRLFRGWVPPVDASIASGARDLFRALGAARDRDALAQQIEPALDRAGAPGVPAAAEVAAPAAASDVAALIAGDASQRWLLALLAWRHGLDAAPSPAGGVVEAAAGSAAESGAGQPEAAPLAPRARRRLARWQRAIVDEAPRFAQLDDAARHRLRRRAKRLRYASEFVESLIGGKETRRFVESLQAVQQALGELADLALAEQHYGRESPGDPRDWFARGWVAARRDALVAQAAAALAVLAGHRPFDKR
ncbi:MAG: CYTH and CHAD domain-containing protein [Burkholderiaceae bacterium]|nr:CYTH and CHAD domain-containing protein [Burkholderiaceae bacterium]